MVFWIITENGRPVRLEDRWTHSFYVAGSKADLQAVTLNKDITSRVRSFEFASKYETIFDHSKSKMLKVTLADSKKSESIANTIWQSGLFGQYRLYNVDLIPAQSYFYQHDLFPLAFCKVELANSGLRWQVEDDVWATDYRLPDFRSIRIDVRLQKQGRLPRFSDRIESIMIRHKAEDIEIAGQSEADIIAGLISTVSKIDPDFVFMNDGDSFGFPYLIQRAEENKIDLLLNRDYAKVALPNYKGTSYFSYGKIHFKPASIALMGRIHLDSSNSFVWNESGMHGFYEVARICRMPLHTAFRASIGKCLSSLQFYHATKIDRLIPWKPEEAEHFKTLKELLLADRGGLILVPKIGVHEKVAEFDFASLYPNIMFKKNVSAETVLCDCCPDQNKVPELGFNICGKRVGIVPTALEIVIKKRARYKQLKKEAPADLKKIYDARQNALKWINVTSFGYLGFNNAKFGRIDSHQAVCAFDRQVLLGAVKAAESMGFRILHSIVDSLWIQKAGATTADYLELKQAIERATGFEISFEGEYKWVAFPASKRSGAPVPNRYFGVFSDDTIKVRGMEARRHDTPPLFSKFQKEVLEIMANGDNVKEVKALLPEVEDAFQRYRQMLKEGRIPLADLVFTKMLSKDSDAYMVNTVETSALYQLQEEGESLRAGQALQYIIADYYRKNSSKRTVPVELINQRTTYDARRYSELLAEVCNSLVEPFGFSLGPPQFEVMQSRF